jgi:hypothetical protein
MRTPDIGDIPPEMLGNMVPQKARASAKEEMDHRPMMEKLAEWAKNNPGSAGLPESLKGGGPGDSDCISVFLASILYKAGQKVRLVLAIGQPKAQGIFVEVFHPQFGQDGQWIAVLPYAQWIFEHAGILKSRRVMEQEL